MCFGLVVKPIHPVIVDGTTYHLNIISQLILEMTMSGKFPHVYIIKTSYQHVKEIQFNFLLHYGSDRIILLSSVDSSNLLLNSFIFWVVLLKIIVRLKINEFQSQTILVISHSRSNVC